MPQFPGWVVYAQSRKVAVGTARELYALLLDREMYPDGRIPSLDRERFPDSSRPELLL
jgi:hypothetical protein